MKRIEFLSDQVKFMYETNSNSNLLSKLAVVCSGDFEMVTVIGRMLIICWQNTFIDPDSENNRDVQRGSGRYL